MCIRDRLHGTGKTKRHGAGSPLLPPVNHASRAAPELAIPRHPGPQVPELRERQPPIVFPQPIHHKRRPRRRQLRPPRPRLLGLHRRRLRQMPVRRHARQRLRIQKPRCRRQVRVYVDLRPVPPHEQRVSGLRRRAHLRRRRAAVPIHRRIPPPRIPRRQKIRGRKARQGNQPLARFAPTYFLAARDAGWRDTAMDRDSRAAAAMVRAAAKPGDTLFVWGYRPEIYVYSHLPAATRFLDSQPLTGVPADRHLTQSTPVETRESQARRAQLAASRPTFVVDGLGEYNRRLAVTEFGDLRAWMAAYREVGRSAGSVIYRLSLIHI